MAVNKKKVHRMKTRSESLDAYKQRMEKIDPKDSQVSKDKRAKTVKVLPETKLAQV